MDWSTNAIGGYISQEIKGIERPIAYESRKLHLAECNYSPYDGELLALIHCLRTFRPYLVGQPIVVKTDQKALQWLLDQKVLSKQQYRWLDVLQELDLRLEWIKGTSNSIADTLGRRSHEVQTGIQVNVIPDIDHSDEF
jgi:RNase H-like domain found in reverse transcriptase